MTSPNTGTPRTDALAKRHLLMTGYSADNITPEKALDELWDSHKQLERELTAAKQEVDDIKNRLDLLANKMVYNGNSVAYIYQKCAAYKDIIGQCCDQFEMDGTTSVVELIKKALSERYQLAAQVEVLRRKAKALDWLLNSNKVYATQWIKGIGGAEGGYRTTNFTTLEAIESAMNKDGM